MCQWVVVEALPLVIHSFGEICSTSAMAEQISTVDTQDDGVPDSPAVDATRSDGLSPVRPSETALLDEG